MLSKIKKNFSNLLKLVGYEIIGAKKLVKHNNFDAIIAFLLKFDLKKNKVFFDVGANLGQSIERFKLIDSNSEIHSFEPTPNLVEILKKKYKHNNKYIINNFGLGSKNKFSKLNLFKYHKINSFIDIDKNSKFYKSRVIASGSNRKDFIKSQKIKIKKLDDYCKSNNIQKVNLLKIDTQGFESDVLQGAQRMLKENKINIIELELVLGFAYKKTLSFFEIEKILTPYSYRLIAIKDRGNLISFSNYQTDLIYVKHELYNKIKNLHSKNINIPGVMSVTNKSNPYSY